MIRIIMDYDIVDISNDLINIISEYTDEGIISRKYIIVGNYFFFEIDDSYYIIYDRKADIEEVMDLDEIIIFLNNLYN